ncbi:MAG: hypothetical protein KatS3mg123_2230 [Burkholderiales bacterium]|nr:MAG: hypothetical protein KatS3mg123_2230 [Burkholderiales bacterium]
METVTLKVERHDLPWAALKQRDPRAARGSPGVGQRRRVAGGERRGTGSRTTRRAPATRQLQGRRSRGRAMRSSGQSAPALRGLATPPKSGGAAAQGRAAEAPRPDRGPGAGRGADDRGGPLLRGRADRRSPRCARRWTPSALQLLEDHTQGCVKGAIRSGDGEAAIAELMDVVQEVRALSRKGGGVFTAEARRRGEVQQLSTAEDAEDAKETRQRGRNSLPGVLRVLRGSRHSGLSPAPRHLRGRATLCSRAASATGRHQNFHQAPDCGPPASQGDAAGEVLLQHAARCRRAARCSPEALVGAHHDGQGVLEGRGLRDRSPARTWRGWPRRRRRRGAGSSGPRAPRGSARAFTR